MQYKYSRYSLYTLYKYGKTALFYAYDNQNFKIYDYLISREANVNILDNSYKAVLHYAVQNQDVEAIKYFLGKEADVNAKGICYVNMKMKTLSQYTQLPLVYSELSLILQNMALKLLVISPIDQFVIVLSNYFKRFTL